MPFSTGLISSPPSSPGFQNGTVVSPDWANKVSGNVNGWQTAGGNNLTAPVLNATASGTSAPTPTPAANYALYRELVPNAVALVSNPAGTATLARGINITSVTRVSTGIIDLVLINDGADMNNSVIQVTCSGAVSRIGAAQCIVGSPNKIRVFTYTDAGVAVDSSFSVTIWAW